jgi:hypothetical protein
MDFGKLCSRLAVSLCSYLLFQLMKIRNAMSVIAQTMMCQLILTELRSSLLTSARYSLRSTPEHKGWKQKY